MKHIPPPPPLPTSAIKPPVLVQSANIPATINTTFRNQRISNSHGRNLVFAHNSKTIGPFSTEQVESLISEKNLPMQAEFCHRDGGEWLTMISFAAVKKNYENQAAENMASIPPPPPVPESIIKKSERRLFFEQIGGWGMAILGTLTVQYFGCNGLITPKGKYRSLKNPSQGPLPADPPVKTPTQSPDKRAKPP